MAKTVRDVLLQALENLEEKSFQKFKNKLHDFKIEDGYDRISKGDLEGAKKQEVTDLIIRYYTYSYGPEVTQAVLEAINERQEAENLRSTINERQEAENLRSTINERQEAENLRSTINERQEAENIRRALMTVKGTLQKQATSTNQEAKARVKGTLQKQATSTNQEAKPRVNGDAFQEPTTSADPSTVNGDAFHQPTTSADSSTGDANSLEDLLVKLGLENYKATKLTLTSLLSIGSKTCKKIEARPLKNVPWYFLQKLMALNRTARNIEPQDIETEDDSEDKELYMNFDQGRIVVSNSVNPLDVVCALLHCSDHLLQRQILLNMSMCQFAVPLLVPSGDGSDCTLLLWAMKDIVKKWRPQSMKEKKGSVENNVVNIFLPIFSFVRVGEYRSSKSNTLNQVLSAEGQHHDFFVHENMSGGNIKRLISNGLVEISWYFPAGNDSDLFPDPVAITNLRGDLLHHRKQVRFLTEISAMVFIFLGNMDEVDKLLSEVDISSNKLFFIININSNNITGKHNTFLEKLSGVGHSNYLFTISKTDHNRNKILEYLTKLFPLQTVNKRIKILNPKTSQDGKISKFLQTHIRNIMAQEERYNNLDNSARVASDIGIAVDENSEECVKTKLRAQEITKDMTDVRDYKKTNMKLQGDLWSQISRNEKEMCRMRGQGGRSGEEYRSHLIMENLDLRRKQYEEKIPNNIRTFKEALTHLSSMEKIYFLDWISFYLDSKFKKNLTSESTSAGHILPDSKLGIEHFLRELGQFYEAECSMVKNKEIEETTKQFNNLPGIAADLLLDGFPLELIDGDASNIPLQWITDVLTELDKKTEGQCRMRVITVLGVQSTGKSTLLNTMFGLQFPVASGRCTRGAFMTLLKVEENFQKEIGCEFILVIDTEGLKAPELSSLDDRYEHDNELATLVVGLSDITIVNINTENTTEMKDILQMVVHAFLRMKKIGKKPNCQFVHQNVSDLSAHDKNMKGKKIFLDHLDEMTKMAAKMESNSDITKFCEIIDYNLEKHNWYIPGLWHGVPPMASVSLGYIENINELKTYLLEFLKQKTNSDSCNIKDFIEWIKSLWNAVKHEKFLFSFQSSLVADAYNQLCIMNSNLEWKFREAAHSWMTKTENEIKNLLATQKESDIMTHLKNNIQKVLDAEAKNMENSLEEYFEGKIKHVRLVEKFKEEFMKSVPLLKQELQFYLNNKCQEVIQIEKEKSKIRKIQGNYQKITEEQVSELLKKHKGDRSKLSMEELESEFETLWKETLQGFNLTLERKNIGQMMLEHLQKDMKNKPGYINEKLINLKDLEKYREKIFKMKTKYLEGTNFTVSKKRFTEFWDEATSMAKIILDRCDRYIFNKVALKQDYHEMFCQQLLDIINEALSDKTVEKYEYKPLFELKIKLFALGKAAPLFQKMHEDFINNNEPKHCLEELKSDYFNTFKQVYEEKDDAKMRAQRFCDRCLQPAVYDYVYSNLGKGIVDEILTGEDSIRYGSRTFFQSALLKSLLEEKKFSEYVEYCLHYEIFTVNWIRKYITERYQDRGRLDPLITTAVTDITKKVRQVLQDQTFLQHSELGQNLNTFCEVLKKDLVISQNNMSVVTFQNSSNGEHFFQYVLSLLSDVENKVINKFKSLNIEDLLSRVTLKPQEELFKKVFICGKQCPFCGVPCEAGAADHDKHFASIHRPQGLGWCRVIDTEVLCHEICTTDMVTGRQFKCKDTNWEFYAYKEYRKIYPDWEIQPDPSIKASIYWKYIFKEFNKEFAEQYKVKEAELPKDWYKITKEQALQSLTAS